MTEPKRFYYRIHKTLSLNCILIPINPVHVLKVQHPKILLSNITIHGLQVKNSSRRPVILRAVLYEFPQYL